jgi:Cu/Zn superoxide dismutase
MRKNFYLLFMLLVIGFSANAGHLSNSLYFSAKLAGSNLVPPVTTSASGVAVFSLNGTYDSLCVNIATTGLSGPITGLHIHEAPAGANGDVVVNFSTFVIENKVNTMFALSDIDMETLLNGGYYINVHTAANPAGEIRGNMNLERDKSYSAWLDEAYVSSGAAGYGLGQFTLSHDNRKLSIKVLTTDLTDVITAAHLHSVATGMVAIGLDSLINGTEIEGVIDYSSFDPDSLNGAYYLNVHTTANPAGEVAGVISFNKGRTTYDSRMNANFHVTSTSPAKGFSQLTLSANMDTLWYDVVWDNLDGVFSAMHIHGASGGVVHNMTPNVTGNEAHGMWVGVPDSVVEMLLGGSAYVNLHTDIHPVGEIAANIVRFAREGYMVNVDAGQTVPLVSSMATGGGLVSINRERNSAHYMVAADNFTGTVSAAHFHNAAAGATGGVIYTLPWMNGGAYGYWSDSSATVFTSTESVLFQGNNVYVNIHSSTAASGEARGQVVRGGSCMGAGATAAADAIDALTGISIYPNPAYSDITVALEADTRIKGNIRVADLSGRILSTQAIDIRPGSNEIKVNLSDLAAGMYIVYINDQQNNRILAKRIAKQ